MMEASHDKKRLKMTSEGSTGPEVGSENNQSSTTNGNEVSMLDVFANNHDALISVLARTCAADHHHLRQTCKTFCSLLNSSRFRSHRAIEELAETKAVLWTREQHRESYRCAGEEDDDDNESLDDYREFGIDYEGATQFRADIWVDGLKQGALWGYMVDRPSHDFHEICDAVSQDLQYVGWTVCDRAGKIRLGEIKQAVKEIPDEALDGLEDIALYGSISMEDGTDVSTVVHNHNNFIYIDEFHLHQPEHRLSTKIGADALRSLLNLPPLAGEWTLITYIPGDRDYITDDVKALDPDGGFRSAHAFLFDDEEKMPDYVEKERAYKLALEGCAKQDMRHFLRAGFRQIKQLRAESACYHVYALPFFLQTAMISDEQVQAIPITEKPVYMDAPSGKDAELLRLFKERCSQLLQTKDAAQRALQGSLNQMEQMRQDVQESVRRLEEYQHVIGTATTPDGESVASLRNAFADYRQSADEAVSQIESEVNNTISSAIEDWKSKIENDARNLIREGADIERANVLHCLAAFGHADLFEMVLDWPSTDERELSSRVQIVNSFDPGGNTPLMCSAGSTRASPEAQYRTCKKLIELGADPYLSNKSNKTAWSAYRNEKRSQTDFGNWLGPEEHERQLQGNRGRELATLLKPPDYEDSEDDDEESTALEDDFIEDDEEDNDEEHEGDEVIEDQENGG